MPVESRDDLVKRLRDLAGETTLKCWEPRHGAWLSGLREAATRIESDAKRIAELEAENADLRCWVATYSSNANEERSRADSAERALAEEREWCARLEASLTPSADTKAAYIGEFSFFIDTVRSDDDGEEVFIAERVLVPWDTVKEIMKAIRDYATAIRSGKPDGKE